MFAFVLPLVPPASSQPQALLAEGVGPWTSLVRLVQRAPLPATASATAIVGAVVTGIMFVAYLGALRAASALPTGRRPLTAVVAVALLIALPAVLMFPGGGSHDVYMYVLYARVLTVHHANPYTTPPSTFPADPHLWLGDWASATTYYGPVWTLLCAALQRYVSDDIVLSVMAIRVLLFAAHLGNMILIWLVAATTRPERQLPSLVFYAWNPVTLLAASSHLDTVMTLFVLGGALLYAKGRHSLGVEALVAATMTKITVAPLLLVDVLLLWRHRLLHRPWWTVVAAGVLIYALVLPFIVGVGPTGPVESPPGQATLVTQIMGFVRHAVGVRFALFTPPLAALVGWMVWRDTGEVSGLVSTWTLILAWFLLWLNPVSASWYAVALVAVASLTPSARLRAVAIALCASALLLEAIAVEDLPRWLLRAIRWGPPLLVAAWAYGDDLRRLLVQLGRRPRRPRLIEAA
jgi:hypothetical protein